MTETEKNMGYIDDLTVAGSIMQPDTLKISLSTTNKKREKGNDDPTTQEPSLFIRHRKKEFFFFTQQAMLRESLNGCLMRISARN